MAKVSKKVQKAREEWAKKMESKVEQLKHIRLSIDSEVRHQWQCFVCGREDEIECGTLAEHAKTLFDEGWRYSSSDQFATQGLMCPECFVTPDERRGE